MTAALEVGGWSAACPGRTLPPGKTGYPFYRRLGGPQGRSGRAENLVPTGIRSPDRPARSSVAIPTELPGPHPPTHPPTQTHTHTHAHTRAHTHTHIYKLTYIWHYCCKVTNKCTIISQNITILHVPTLLCHPQGAFNEHLVTLHKYFKCSCW